MKRPHLVPKSGARALAADIVARVLDDAAWAQPSLASALGGSQLDARDKALCTELVYGTLRWATSLEKSLLRSADKPGRGLDKRMRPHLLVAAYQLQHLSERIPARAAVNEAVDAVRAVRPGLEGFANALLRKLGSPVHSTLPPTASVHDVADAIGVPHVLADAIAAIIPAAEMKDALLGLNGRPQTFGMGVRADVKLPAGAVPHAFVPGAYVLEGGAVADAGGFRSGDFIVVDPGSAVAALLVGAKPGMRIIDLCAAPGGKSMMLARDVGDDGRIVAVEKSDKRVVRIRENAARTRLDTRIEVVGADATKVSIAPADAVLLDAPCSGFGTTRRKPEIKLRRTAADIETDAALQRTLLEAAVRLVKPGGVLVYSVCSPIPAEGALQIEAFMKDHPELTLADARATLPWLPVDAVDAQGQVHLLPHRHDADAFFCARMVRRLR